MKQKTKIILSKLLIFNIFLLLINPLCVCADEPIAVNLALGKSYEKSEEPSIKYGDENNESTDGILALNYTDSKSYGYNIQYDGGKKNVDITLNLSQELIKISQVRVHQWQGFNSYGPDAVTVYVSVDGQRYNIVGSATTPKGIWYDIRFKETNAKYVKVNFTKLRSNSSLDWLFIDEIEVYSMPVNAPMLSTAAIASSPNLAFGKKYKKSIQPSIRFADTGNESTDGVLAGDYIDTNSYGYTLDGNENTKSVDITLDLSAKAPIKVSNVKVHKWQGIYDYGADIVTVYVSVDGLSFVQVGSTTAPNDLWFDVSFKETDAKYVRVNFLKTKKGSDSNWLFIDEIEVYNEPTPISSDNDKHTPHLSLEELLLATHMYMLFKLILIPN